VRELSLFSGAGGGLLGTKLLGWKHCGYVEYNDYCQRVIRQRILDGILENAPIFGDIRAFIDEGYAASYQGMVDVVTAGFPCQPFSVAGKQQGEDDERNMWPQTLAVLRAVRPRFALLENVAGLLAHEYARRIFGDLAESGFDARWRLLSAAEVGAPHKRDRLWIIADNHSIGGRIQQELTEWQDTSDTYDNGKKEYVADSQSKFGNVSEFHGEHSQSEVSESGNNGGKISDSSGERLEGQQLQGRTGKEYARAGGSCWWASEPGMGRVANGLAHRVDRLKAIGNGQCSPVVRAAWELLA